MGGAGVGRDSVERDTDVIVVGAGPAGASAALFLTRWGLRVSLVDPLGVGGQLVNVEHVPDYPGHPDGITGWDLAAALGEHVLAAGVDLVMGRASALRPRAGGAGWEVDVDGSALRGRAAVLATGCRPRPLPGADGLEGRGVSYCAVCDAGLFAGRRVAVVGAGDVAIAEARTLAAVAASVTLITPRSDPAAPREAALPLTVPPASPDLADLAGRPGVRVVAATGVPEVIAEGGVVGGVQFVEGVDDAERAEGRDDAERAERLDGAEMGEVGGRVVRRLAVDGVFGALDPLPNGELLAPVGRGVGADGIDTDRRGAVSAQPGLFAAGDVRAGGPRRAVAAAGDGATVAHAVAVHLAR